MNSIGRRSKRIPIQAEGVTAFQDRGFKDNQYERLLSSGLIAFGSMLIIGRLSEVLQIYGIGHFPSQGVDRGKMEEGGLWAAHAFSKSGNVSRPGNLKNKPL